MSPVFPQLKFALGPQKPILRSLSERIDARRVKAGRKHKWVMAGKMNKGREMEVGTENRLCVVV